jgi:hypothetical protein
MDGADWVLGLTNSRLTNREILFDVSFENILCSPWMCCKYTARLGTISDKRHAINIPFFSAMCVQWHQTIAPKVMPGTVSRCSWFSESPRLPLSMMFRDTVNHPAYTQDMPQVINGRGQWDRGRQPSIGASRLCSPSVGPTRRRATCCFLSVIGAVTDCG